MVLSPRGCRQRPPGATIREQSGPGTSRPRASSRDAPPPLHGCPRGHSSFHLSRLSSPFRMQPGSASSPTRLPRSPARHGAGPDPGKSSPIPHPENVLFQQKWTRGWHSTRCRHVTRSRESTGEGTAAPRDGGRGTEKASALGPALYFRPKVNAHN